MKNHVGNVLFTVFPSLFVRTQLKDISHTLGVVKLSNAIISQLLKGFENFFTKNFRLMCSTLHMNFLSSFTKMLLGSMSLQMQLVKLLCDLKATYLELKTGGEWISASAIHDCPPTAEDLLRLILGKCHPQMTCHQLRLTCFIISRCYTPFTVIFMLYMQTTTPQACEATRGSTQIVTMSPKVSLLSQSSILSLYHFFIFSPWFS